MTRTAALEFAASGVRVNAICPGLVQTPMVSVIPKEVIDDITAGIPLGRGADPNCRSLFRVEMEHYRRRSSDEQPL
ncbi:SDR family oxidoreductase [Nocardia sp. NPDC050412]|uniref:SDR family oxidoreductase n=1 Tax=Nocardia sp. NPDC050412 TaxID=3364320 RepID=UPI0037AC41C0